MKKQVVFITCAISLSSVVLASDFIKVEGTTDKKLARVRQAIEKSAYGVDGSKKEKPVLSGSAATAPEKDDACTAFYQPPPKLRLLKTMPTVDPCIGKKTTLLADTEIQVLFLCKDGNSVGDYDFSMGRSGVNKRMLDDKKTPLGKYPLSAPRSSDLFKVFIPVGYPTPAQEKFGYTGSDVGIHGPPRGLFRCTGFLNDSVNWTRGCLAVSSDIFIKEIGRFVESNNVKEISILPLGQQELN